MAPSASRPVDRPLLHLALLGATAFTTFFTYFVFYAASDTSSLLRPLAFSGTVIAILGTHEMGHYFAARRHGVDTTLPYFIPFPLGFGTLGAVIRIRGLIPTRTALVDIGASGPLAGLAVAIPLIFIGFRFSSVEPLAIPPQPFPGELSAFGLVPRVVEWVTATVAGTPLAQESFYVYGDPLLLQLLQYAALGPLPEEAVVRWHPMVLAGWFGLLVTTLNLWPIGQLDGGHVTYALFGSRARWIGELASGVGLFLTLFFSVSWFLWWLLTRKVIGFSHPEVVVPAEPLARSRVVVAVLCAVALILCVLPTPVRIYSP